jgi:ISXO2-like transposase domain/Transposase zinc-ribbon domain
VAKPGFPRSIVEFQRWFPDEEACRRYLIASRWPEGFRCPRCDCGEAVLLATRSLWQCTGCHYQVSLTAGTVLQGTRTPLHLWFWAAYLVSTATPGISAVQLQRQLDLGRYETAWIILQKLRRAMVNPERQPLTGAVEVDECFVGGLDRDLRGGRQHGTKALVVVAVEVRGAGCGRVRMQVIADASTATLCGFVTEVVAAGAVVHTDGWNGYRRLRTLGYNHRPRSQRTAGVPAADLDEILPRVHRVISTSRAGCRAPTAACPGSTCRSTWTSTSSASTGAGPRWRPFRPCSASAASNHQPPTGTSMPRDPARPRLLTPPCSDA